MATFRVSGGVLTGAVMSGNYPDNSLPGDQPGIDNSLPGSQPGIDNSLPVPPPGVWPPPVPAHPIIPAPPGTPPGAIWPPPYPSHGLPGQGAGSGLHPDQGLPPTQPGYPDQGLPPGSPGAPDQTLPPTSGPHPEHPIAGTTYWMLVYTPGYGWKYVTVDPSLGIWHDPAAPQPVPTPH